MPTPATRSFLSLRPLCSKPTTLSQNPLTYHLLSLDSLRRKIVLCRDTPRTGVIISNRYFMVVKRKLNSCDIYLPPVVSFTNFSPEIHLRSFRPFRETVCPIPAETLSRWLTTFPGECSHVLETLAKVCKNDKPAKEKK